MTDTLKIALVAFVFAAGWMGRTWYDNSVQLAIERVKDDVAIVTATAIAGIKTENKTIYAKTVEHSKTDIVYVESKADPEMMMLTNKVLEWK